MKTFTVRGRGRFPVDMLRYDNCWPSTSDDATNLAASLQETDLSEIWVVTLTTCNTTIAAARWESFGWVVKGAK